MQTTIIIFNLALTVMYIKDSMIFIFNGVNIILGTGLSQMQTGGLAGGIGLLALVALI
jgi:hypothetical protein